GYSCGEHLLKRGPFVDHDLDAIADDHHHVSIFGNLPLIAQTSVAGNDQGPAFLAKRNGFVQDVIQSGNLATHAAAILHINKWITARVQNASGHDDIATPATDNCVTLRSSGRVTDNT